MINDSLAALRDLIVTVQATGQPPIRAGYAYPAQQATMPETIDPDDLPLVITHRRTSRRGTVGTLAAGRAKHMWLAHIDLLLAPGPLVNEEQIREADAMFEPWLIAMYGVLFQNLTLTGTADMIGSGVPGGDFLDYIDTHLQWFGKVFWGVRFELMVKQTWAQTMTAA